MARPRRWWRATACPRLRLAPGSYAVSGRFEWSSRPESLPLPDTTAIVDLTVDGQRVAQPERPDGGVWLGKRRSAEQAAAHGSAGLSPGAGRDPRLSTHAHPPERRRRSARRVARRARCPTASRRSVAAAAHCPRGSSATARLRVQVRAGSHEIIAGRARHAASPARWRGPSRRRPSGRARKSGASPPTTRCASPRPKAPRASIPRRPTCRASGASFPAFRMAADAKLTVVERSRGLANADDNRLSLQSQPVAGLRSRRLHRRRPHPGHHAPRLAARHAGAVRAAERAPERRAAAGHRRRRGPRRRRAAPAAAQSQLPWRARPRGGAMPATGWDSRFDRVDGTLHLPPGHRLIAAIGADAAPGSWWERWGLWNVFGVLIVVVFVYWTAGLRPGGDRRARAGAHVPGGAGLHLAVGQPARRARHRARRARRALPAHSRAAIAPRASWCSALALLPFLWMQVRFALYPQLESQHAAVSAGADGRADSEIAATRTPPRRLPMRSGVVRRTIGGAGTPMPPPSEADIVDERSSDASEEPRWNPPATSVVGLNSAQVVQRYAAGTVLQAGPGIPAWRYNSYAYSWSRPGRSRRHGALHLRRSGRAVLLAHCSACRRWRAVRLAGAAELRQEVAAARHAARAGASAGTLPALLAPAAARRRWRSRGATPRRSAQRAGARAARASSRRGSPRRRPARRTAPRSPPRAWWSTATGSRSSLQVSALANVAVAMPHASDRWQLDEVERRRARLAGDGARRRRHAVGAAHRRRAHRAARRAGSRPPNPFQLAFPQPPRVIDVTRARLDGQRRQRRPAGLGLARAGARARRAAQRRRGARGRQRIPGVRARRSRLQSRSRLDGRHRACTRIAPQRAALSVEIPLVKGESVLTAGVKVRDGDRRWWASARARPQTQWHSGLARARNARSLAARRRGAHRGLELRRQPAVERGVRGISRRCCPKTSNAPIWVFRFMPRPGEKLVRARSRGPRAPRAPRSPSIR